MYNRTDTIAAIATGAGEGAIGIVRISGPDAGEIIDRIVPKVTPSLKPRKVLGGLAHEPANQRPIDEVLCFYLPGPGTATGEDTAELQGHGGRVTMSRLLDAALTAGAVAAKPGEFTYRAFRNGRMDLTQAEAVMSLIGARSERAQQLALRHLEGGLGADLDAELAALVDVAARIEARLDFPDEDLPVDESDLLAGKLDSISTRLRLLETSYTLGQRLSQGAQVAIIGPPNAGKSSLLNALIHEDKALVDAEPGTTRDVVEARSEAGGIPLTFLDTAGIRDGSGRVESRGIEKTFQAAKTADLVVAVLDGSSPLENAASEMAVLLSKLTRPALVTLNKMDLPGFHSALPESLAGCENICISAAEGAGIEQLLTRIGALLSSDHEDESHILTTARQQRAVQASAECVNRARNILLSAADTELAAADLRWAREELAALWGRSAEDDVIDAIFTTFCLGK